MSLSILSFLAIVSILPISFLARNLQWQSGLLLARQLTLPMGLIVTLLLLVKLLGTMGDPSLLYSLLAESMLPSVFALMQYTILSQVEFTNSPTHQPWQIRLATGSIVGIVLLYAGLQGFLSSIIELDTLCTLGVGIFGLRWIQRRFPSTKVQTIGNLAVQVAFLNACYRGTKLILYWEDPTSIGPNMASIILGLMYGFIIWMLSELRTELHPEASPLEHPISSSMIIGTFFLSYAPIVLFSFSIDIGQMNQQTRALNIQTDYQHQLLRDMVIHHDDNDSGHITISSDKPAWIFIDDRLVSTSPLFKHDLEPGEHTVKIANCPTYDFMNPEDNISWNEYWGLASDGSCREPSEEELRELIAKGLAKEIITETVDEYAMIQIEYQPGVNFCCHDSPTKTIQVNMTEEPVVYAWSFVNDEWIQASNIQN